MSTIAKVRFSIDEIKEMMENKIIHSQDNDVEKILSSELSQFNDGGEDKFTLSIHAKTKSAEKSRSKTFSNEQIEHLLANTAAAENGEVVDEIENINSVKHSNGDVSVFYKAFDTSEHPPKSDYDKVEFKNHRKELFEQWQATLINNIYGKFGERPDDWLLYLSNLRDTTECDGCPFNRMCPDSLAK